MFRRNRAEVHARSLSSGAQRIRRRRRDVNLRTIDSKLDVRAVVREPPESARPISNLLRTHVHCLDREAWIEMRQHARSKAQSSIRTQIQSTWKYIPRGRAGCDMLLLYSKAPPARKELFSCCAEVMPSGKLPRLYSAILFFHFRKSVMDCGSIRTSTRLRLASRRFIS